MDDTTAKLVALAILAIVAIVFIVRFGGEGRVKIKTFFGSVETKGRNHPPNPSIQAEAVMRNVQAEGNALNESRGGGNAIMESSRFAGDATNRQVTEITDKSPPKA